MGLSQTEELMNRWLLLFFTLTLTACTASTAPAAQTPRSTYPDLGVAPELVGDNWLNSTSPLRLSDLRGKVVLVDMWTFG